MNCWTNETSYWSSCLKWSVHSHKICLCLGKVEEYGYCHISTSLLSLSAIILCRFKCMSKTVHIVKFKSSKYEDNCLILVRSLEEEKRPAMLFK